MKYFYWGIAAAVVLTVLAVLFVVLLVAALVDGGEEPLRPIEQAIELPEVAR